MKIKTPVYCLALAIVLFSFRTYSQADNWMQVMGDGFGTVNNESVGEFEIYNGFLYAGTKRKQGIPGVPELWRTATGDSGGWVKVTGFSPALDNGGNIVSFATTTLPGNYFWLGTLHKMLGAAVYRSSDGISWTKINSNGFGNTGNTLITPHMVVYQDTSDSIAYLYAGTENDVTGAQLWRTPYTSSAPGGWTKIMDFAAMDTAIKIITYLYVWEDKIYFGTAGSGGGKGQLWEAADGINFTKNPNAGDGFGDPGNYAITSMADFQNQLYVTTRHQNDGGEVWRTADGTNWQQITSDAFGKGGTVDELHNIRVSFGKIWITGLSSATGTSGYPVWRSGDGLNFIQSNTDGFGDANNKGNAPVTIGFGNYQYCGGNNSVTGAQIWRACAVSPVSGFSYTATGLSVNFTDSSSDATGWSWDFGDGNMATVQNPSHTYPAAGNYNVCLVTSNACGTDTACDSLTVADPSGINNISLQKKITLYPNPFQATTTLIIVDELVTSPLEIRMYDIFGREAMRMHTTKNKEITLARDNLAGGLYLIKVIKDGKVIDAKKIVVE